MIVFINRYTITLVLLFLAACSSLSVIEDRDDRGRIIKKSTFKKGKLKQVAEITYKKDSGKPSKILHLRSEDGKLLPYLEERFQYKNDKNGILTKADYSIFLNHGKPQRVKSGYSNFYLDGEYRPLKFEYFSIAGIDNKKMFRSCLDLYGYSGDKKLETRRIIEYDYNPETRKEMQLSQYVLSYRDGKIETLQIWILDRKTGKIIKKQENNRKIIDEVVYNIEKSIKDRSKGLKFLK